MILGLSGHPQKYCSPLCSLMDFLSHPAVWNFLSSFTFLSLSKITTFSSNKKVLNELGLLKKFPMLRLWPQVLFWKRASSGLDLYCSYIKICINVPDSKTANLFSRFNFKSTPATCFSTVTAWPSVMQPNSSIPPGAELTHVINTVLKCKHSDDLSYKSQNWPLHFFTLSNIQKMQD